MVEQELQTQIDAANAYEALFVSALFEQWAPKVADAAQIKAGQSVLDVACGTGVLAREVTARLGSGAKVVGVDPNPGMITVAGRLAPTVEWRVGAAEALAFSDQTFDAVVSQFGLMFFTDRHRALCEMWRVLAPGGRLAIAVWDALAAMPAYATLVALLERTAGRPAADALRAPFVLGERKELAALFTEAGIAETEVSTSKGTARFPSIRVMVEADLRGWLPVIGIHLAEDEIHGILQEAERALAMYATAGSRVAFQISAHIVTAKKL